MRRQNRSRFVVRPHLLRLEDRTVPSFFSAASFPTGVGPQDLSMTDIDNDQDLDLITVNETSNTISVLRANGQGSFRRPRTYSVAEGIRSLIAADLDADGDADMAVGNYVSDTVNVLLNHGKGHFAPAVSYPAGIDPRSLAVGDLDGDQDLDLVVATWTKVIQVLYNQGDATFVGLTSFAVGDQPESVAVDDMDGDGDLDVVTGNRDSISLLKNQGNGTFAAPLGFHQTSSEVLSVALGDVNGDTHRDIVFTKFSIPGVVVVMLNSGIGTFGAASSHLVPPDFHGDVALGDLDGDQDLDIVTEQTTVLWNNGFGEFSTSTDYISGPGSTSVALGDLDNDQDLDVATANAGTNDVSILRNLGGGKLAAGNTLPVDRAHGAAAGDLDSDNDIDLVTIDDFSRSQVWFNLGNGSFAAGSSLNTDRARSAHLVDLDGDQDLDLAIAHDSLSAGTVTVRLNLGNGTFAPKTTYTIAGNHRPRSMAVGDLDGDLDLDFFVGLNWDEYRVLTNDGDGTFTIGGVHEIGGIFRSVALGDLDGDQDADAVVAANDGVYLLQNLGDGTFGPLGSYASTLVPIAVSVGDLDGDQDFDFAVAYSAAITTVFLNDGNAVFSATDYPSGVRPTSLAMSDVDLDQDLDLVVGDDLSPYVTVLPNPGNGNFGAQTRYYVGGDSISVTAADLDGDNYPEIAVANNNQDVLVILFNDGIWPPAPISSWEGQRPEESSMRFQTSTFRPHVELNDNALPPSASESRNVGEAPEPIVAFIRILPPLSSVSSDQTVPDLDPLVMVQPVTSGITDVTRPLPVRRIARHTESADVGLLDAFFLGSTLD